MSFYRIYRPTVLDEIDNKTVASTLLSLLTKPKKDLPHAFLFTGPRGAGKTTAARIVAKLFNCMSPNASGAPCGTCESCVAISEGKNLDVLEIDAASNRGIEEIRELRNGIGLAPVAGAYKVYIIDEVHMLTTEAFNALLKTLEEPPAHAVFVLATTDAQKVPATIQSRCVCISFAKASSKELMTALQRIVKAEKIDIQPDALELITSRVDGSFRDAVKMLEQVSFLQGTITSDAIRKTLSLTSDFSSKQVLEYMHAQKIEEALRLVEDLAATGVDMKSFITQILEDLHNEMVSAVQANRIEDANRSGLMIKKLLLAWEESKFSPIPQIPLEIAIVELGQPQASSPQALQTKQAVPVVSPVHQPKPVIEKTTPVVPPEAPKEPIVEPKISGETLTTERLIELWPDVIATVKPLNHSVAGFLRSSRPKEVKGGIVTIEAFYTFHKEKLSEIKTREMLGTVLKKLFGITVTVDVILGKK